MPVQNILEENEQVTFENVFELDKIQQIQDDFAKAVGVASVITKPDGTPITKPINFSRLCNDIVRKTELGLSNCQKSDAFIGALSREGPVVQPCLSCGLLDAGAAIVVGGKHLANWLIGQVRDENQTDESIRQYAKVIGADVEDAVSAFNEIPNFSRERFEHIAQALFTLANQTSSSAYQILLQKVYIAKSEQAEKERLILEQDYQMLFHEMLDGFSLHQIICDTSGTPIDYRFLAVNPSFEQMTGLKGEDLIGKTVLEIMPEIEKHWIETYGQVALTGEPTCFENYSGEIDKHFSVTAYQPAQNQFACIFTDITERKKTRQKLIQLNADLATKNDELEQMVYVVSHDLRSPLVNIDGYGRELNYSIDEVQIILDNTEPAQLPQALSRVLHGDIQDSLKYIRASTSKMDKLLSGLLKLSRSGRAKLSIDVLDMNKLITGIIDATEYLIKKDGIQVTVDTLPQCAGDADQVNQIFSNIISNALKYLSPKRSGTVHISGQIEGENSLYCIEDGGLGIDQAHLNKIFELFHRLNPMESKGEGLGLTIVKRAVDRLNGKVWVESEPDVGSRFFVSLPHNKLKNITRVGKK